MPKPDVKAINDLFYVKGQSDHILNLVHLLSEEDQEWLLSEGKRIFQDYYFQIDRRASTENAFRAYLLVNTNDTVSLSISFEVKREPVVIRAFMNADEWSVSPVDALNYLTDPKKAEKSNVLFAGKRFGSRIRPQSPQR